MVLAKVQLQISHGRRGLERRPGGPQRLIGAAEMRQSDLIRFTGKAMSVEAPCEGCRRAVPDGCNSHTTPRETGPLRAPARSAHWHGCNVGQQEAPAWHTRQPHRAPVPSSGGSPGWRRSIANNCTPASVRAVRSAWLRASAREHQGLSPSSLQPSCTGVASNCRPGPRAAKTPQVESLGATPAWPA